MKHLDADTNGNGKSEYAIFTVCNLAYLPKALVLSESLKKYSSGKLIVYLFDKKKDFDFTKFNAEFIWIEDCDIPKFYELAFKYDVTELTTSLKPLLTIKLLKRFNKVIFLDPDICVYNSINPILNDLESSSVVLTPHYITPFPVGDIGMMRFGSFNLGFYAVKDSEQGLSFLNWWSERCLEYCYFETQFGLSTDQKWVSIAPCFFKDLHISFNMGYNVAFWNVHERKIKQVSDGGYIVNQEYPLIFFHFSSFDETSPEILSKRPFLDKNKKRTDLVQIAREYNDELQRFKIDASMAKYGFDYMSNGDYISPTLRRAYASVVAEMPVNHDPFDSNGIVGRFAKKNYLFERSGKPYVPAGYNDVKDHKLKFLLINKMLKALLVLVGPNRFQNISRLMVYLSSFRQNRGFWKYDS
jgi:hypothetical protein